MALGRLVRRNSSTQETGEAILRYQETVCSIVAADLKAGEFGVGVASTSLAVGKNVPFTGAYVGAVAVQGYTGPFFGIAGMKLLREGLPAEKVVEDIMSDDPLKDSRQVLIVDVAGHVAAFSGGSLPHYAGVREGEAYIVGGCGLPGKELIDNAAKAFEETPGDLAARLLAALGAMAASTREASFASAAIRISKNDAFPYVDLRVDSHPDPVGQLRKLLDTWRKRAGVPNPANGNGGKAPNGAAGRGPNGANNRAANGTRQAPPTKAQ